MEQQLLLLKNPLPWLSGAIAAQLLLIYHREVMYYSDWNKSIVFSSTIVFRIFSNLQQLYHWFFTIGVLNYSYYFYYSSNSLRFSYIFSDFLPIIFAATLQKSTNWLLTQKVYVFYIKNILYIFNDFLMLFLNYFNIKIFSGLYSRK